MDNSRMKELVDHLQALDLEQTGLGVACKCTEAGYSQIE